MSYVRKVQEIIATGGEEGANLKRGSKYSDMCEKIVLEVIQDPNRDKTPIAERYAKLLSILEVGEDAAETHASMLRFVSGYYDFKYWRSMALSTPLESLEMDHMSLFLWFIFFNDHRLLGHILENSAGPHISLVHCMIGEQQPLEYVLTSHHTKEEILTITVEKVGLLIGLMRKSFDCLRLLLTPRSEHTWTKNLLTGPEMLEFALILAHQPPSLWADIVAYDKAHPADSGKPSYSLEQRLLNMTESAFVGASFAKRLWFLKYCVKVSKIGAGSFLERLIKHSVHLKHFMTWVSTQRPQDCSDPLLQETRVALRVIPNFLLSGNNEASKDSELSRIAFQGRYKPQKVENALIDHLGKQSQSEEEQEEDNDMSVVHLNDVSLQPKGPPKKADRSGEKDSAEIESD